MCAVESRATKLQESQSWMATRKKAALSLRALAAPRD